MNSCRENYLMLNQIHNYNIINIILTLIFFSKIKTKLKLANVFHSKQFPFISSFLKHFLFNGNIQEVTSFEHLSFSPYFVPWRQKVSPILFIVLIFHFIFTTLQAFLLYTSYFEFAIRNHTLLDINQSIFPN